MTVDQLPVIHQLTVLTPTPTGTPPAGPALALVEFPTPGAPVAPPLPPAVERVEEAGEDGSSFMAGIVPQDGFRRSVLLLTMAALTMFLFFLFMLRRRRRQQAQDYRLVANRPYQSRRYR